MLECLGQSSWSECARFSYELVPFEPSSSVVEYWKIKLCWVGPCLASEDAIIPSACSPFMSQYLSPAYFDLWLCPASLIPHPRSFDLCCMSFFACLLSFVPYPTSLVLCTTSYVTQPTSCVIHSASYVLSPSSRSLFPVFYVPRPTFWVLPPVFYFLCPTSRVLQPGSYVKRNILHSQTRLWRCF